MPESLDDRVASIEKRLVRIDTIFWVVTAVAAIFGISGTFGYTIIKSAKTEIETLQADIKPLRGFVDNAEGFVEDAKGRDIGRDRPAGCEYRTDLERPGGRCREQAVDEPVFAGPHEQPTSGRLDGTPPSACP